MRASEWSHISKVQVSSSTPYFSFKLMTHASHSYPSDDNDNDKYTHKDKHKDKDRKVPRKMG